MAGVRGTGSGSYPATPVANSAAKPQMTQARLDDIIGRIIREGREGLSSEYAAARPVLAGYKASGSVDAGAAQLRGAVARSAAG